MSGQCGDARRKGFGEGNLVNGDQLSGPVWRIILCKLRKCRFRVRFGGKYFICLRSNGNMLFMLAIKLNNNLRNSINSYEIFLSKSQYTGNCSINFGRLCAPFGVFKINKIKK